MNLTIEEKREVIEMCLKALDQTIRSLLNMPESLESQLFIQHLLDRMKEGDEDHLDETNDGDDQSLDIVVMEVDFPEFNEGAEEKSDETY